MEWVLVGHHEDKILEVDYLYAVYDILKEDIANLRELQDTVKILFHMEAIKVALPPDLDVEP